MAPVRWVATGVSALFASSDSDLLVPKANVAAIPYHVCRKASDDDDYVCRKADACYVCRKANTEYVCRRANTDCKPCGVDTGALKRFLRLF